MCCRGNSQPSSFSSNQSLTTWFLPIVVKRTENFSWLSHISMLQLSLRERMYYLFFLLYLLFPMFIILSSQLELRLISSKFQEISYAAVLTGRDLPFNVIFTSFSLIHLTFATFFFLLSLFPPFSAHSYFPCSFVFLSFFYSSFCVSDATASLLISSCPLLFSGLIR